MPESPHTAEHCNHQECVYLRAHDSDKCRNCGATRHAVDSDWGSYAFGHGGGQVGFLTVCPSCGNIDHGTNMESVWSNEQLERAANFKLFGSSHGNLGAYSGVVNSGTVKAGDKWYGVVTAKVRKPGGGVPETEDMTRSFEDKKDAEAWVKQRTREIQGGNQ